MGATGTAFLESPPTVAWLIFWLYGLLIVLGGHYLLKTFRREGIVYGHLDELFRFLTRVRVWSIRYRKTYIVAVTAVLSFAFLTLVYVAELLHGRYYGTEPVFSGTFDYFRWIGVVVFSQLQNGQMPNSTAGFVLSAVFPLFVIGAVLTIVRVTSERAHDALIEQMAEGSIAPYRIIVFNYRPEHDPFITALLEESDAFVVIFAKEEHKQDAISFKDGIESTGATEYRMAVEDLSYSEDVLFEQYEVLESDELYVFPDAESRTDYENLRLVSRLNDEVAASETDQNRSVDPPDTIWMADSRKLSGVAHNLEQTAFKRQLHAMNFQDDVRAIVRANTGDTVHELDEYFNLTETTTPPPWVTGYALANYTFSKTPLTDDERSTLADVRAERTASSSDSQPSVDQRRVAELRASFVDTVASRLEREHESRQPDAIAALFGLLADVASTTIPVDLTTAPRSRQVETATDALELRKTTNAPAIESTAGDSDGDVFVVNYNSKIKDYVLSFDADEHERSLTMFTSEDQITPERTDHTTFVEYRSMNDLLEMLFEETDRSPNYVTEGDSILLVLDHSIPNPKVNVLRALDAIDDKLRSADVAVDHNDVFLAVESDAESGNEEYRYLAVDTVVETQRTQRLFLHNLVTLRTSDVVASMLQEGKISTGDAFQWAVETAYYFREYRIDSSDRPHPGDRTGDSIAGATLDDLSAAYRDAEQDASLPLTTFSLERTDADSLRVVLDERTPDHRVEDGQYLLSFPGI